MKFYSEPKTKAMALNLSTAICSEPEVVSEEPIVPPPGEEAIAAPMF